jgi:hypothetical protein
VVVVLALAVGTGIYWYRHRPTPHSSAIDAAEAFVRDLYGGPPGSAQAMLLPGQHLSVLNHPEAPVSFAVTGITRNGADQDVDLLVCTTSDGRGCGGQSLNGTPAVVPTRRVKGAWYVDQSMIVPCGGPTGGPASGVCQE